MDIILKYDAKADILVIRIGEGDLRDEKLLDNDVVLGFDEKGNMVRAEILDASRKGLLKALKSLAKDKKLKETILS
jgi:uncharacterized protein YuzE